MAATNTSSRPVWLIPLLIVVIAGALVAALLLTGGDDEEAAQSEEPGAGAQAEDEANSEGEGGSEGEGDSDDEGPVAEVVEPESQQTLDTSRREEGDALAAGDVEAPVSLVVYSDYQCP